MSGSSSSSSSTAIRKTLAPNPRRLGVLADAGYMVPLDPMGNWSARGRTQTTVYCKLGGLGRVTMHFQQNGRINTAGAKVLAPPRMTVEEARAANRSAEARRLVSFVDNQLARSIAVEADEEALMTIVNKEVATEEAAEKAEEEKDERFVNRVLCAGSSEDCDRLRSPIRQEEPRGGRGRGRGRGWGRGPGAQNLSATFGSSSNRVGPGGVGASTGGQSLEGVSVMGGELVVDVGLGPRVLGPMVGEFHRPVTVPINIIGSHGVSLGDGLSQLSSPTDAWARTIAHRVGLDGYQRFHQEAFGDGVRIWCGYALHDNPEPCRDECVTCTLARRSGSDPYDNGTSRFLEVAENRGGIGMAPCISTTEINGVSFVDVGFMHAQSCPCSGFAFTEECRAGKCVTPLLCLGVGLKATIIASCIVYSFNLQSHELDHRVRPTPRYVPATPFACHDRLRREAATREDRPFCTKTWDEWYSFHDTVEGEKKAISVEKEVKRQKRSAARRASFPAREPSTLPERAAKSPGHRDRHLQQLAPPPNSPVTGPLAVHG